MTKIVFVLVLGNKAPRYEEIRDLRLTVDEEKKESVYIFYKHIMPCVCGKKFWRSRFQNETVSQMTPVSIEALALWIVHNYEDKWSNEERNKSVPALYTGMCKGNKMFTGWDNAGIQKYNEFCNFIRQNRMEGPEFESEIQMRLIEDDKEDVINRRVEQHQTTIDCFDDLDEKLEGIPRIAQHNMPLQTTVFCNTGANDVASTISSSSASTSYRSAEYYNGGNSVNDNVHSVAI